MELFSHNYTDEEDELPPLAIPIISEAQPSLYLAAGKPDNAAPATEFNSVVNIPTLRAPAPVLLLTGFLGSGKTTLINYILTQNHGHRIAVLLNEFADTADIERALVREPEGKEAAPLTDWVELENGCLCCSAKNDMILALESLMQQRDRFDYIIIETTGLANPGPIAAALWTDTELESSICLDAIVTVIDAKNISKYLHEPRPPGIINESQQQIAFADIILLNKVDIVETEELNRIEVEVRGINSEALVIPCEYCAIDLNAILHTGLYTGSSSVNMVENEREEQEDLEIQRHDGSCCDPTTCSHPGHVKSHDPSIRTVSLRASDPVDLQQLRHWLDELLWAKDGGPDGADQDLLPDVFRVKGLLHAHDSDTVWVLQGVHELYDITEARRKVQGAESGERKSKVVFIGRHLDGEKLQKDLIERCCVVRGT